MSLGDSSSNQQFQAPLAVKKPKPINPEDFSMKKKHKSVQRKEERSKSKPKKEKKDPFMAYLEHPLV